MTNFFENEFKFLYSLVEQELKNKGGEEAKDQ